MGRILLMKVLVMGKEIIEEASILDFVISYELVIVNSYFKKKEDHLMTFRTSNTKTQIDFF